MLGGRRFLIGGAKVGQQACDGYWLAHSSERILFIDDDDDDDVDNILLFY